MNLDQYKQIFLDFDGVICKSNEIKKKNIYLAAKKFINSKISKEFAEYFINNSGIPREIKIFEYFNDTTLSKSILEEYNKLNHNLVKAKLTPGLITFIKRFKDKELIVLSGGDKKEIENFFCYHKIQNYFREILCGPLTKFENLKNFEINYPALFIGDTEYDYEVAKTFQLEFIFMYQSNSAMLNKELLENIKKTKNFTTLLKGNFYE